MPVTFKDENRAMQELVRELELLRKHNKTFKEGAPQHHLLMFAESAVVNVALEHFVRIVVGDQAPPKATLHQLLEIAAARKLLVFPGDDPQEVIREICGIRNTTLHGNYAQAAQESGCTSVAEYFRKEFTPLAETLYLVLNDLAKQIDPKTGLPYPRQE